MNVVLDTNVVLSALLFSGPTARLHALWTERRIVPVANRAMMHEYARVLAYPKFGLTGDEVAAALGEDVFPYFRIIRTRTRQVTYAPRDPDDTPFLVAALDGGVAALVSGDPHLLALSGKYPFSIVTPAAFLAGIG